MCISGDSDVYLNGGGRVSSWGDANLRIRHHALDEEDNHQQRVLRSGGDEEPRRDGHRARPALAGAAEERVRPARLREIFAEIFTEI